MSRMFKSITRTWNVFVGCRFNCTYCSARKLALNRLRYSPRYKDGFNPHLVESELNKTFKPGEFIFIAYMGDISFAYIPDMGFILRRIIQYPETRFLLCTKNPRCFHQWRLDLPENIVLATTIETNYRNRLSEAPPPPSRYWYLKSYGHPHKMLSIEPVMDFDHDVLLSWVADISPEIIEVGADNYHNHLPEPSPDKLERLLEDLRAICPSVIEKDGLSRLKERR